MKNLVVIFLSLILSIPAYSKTIHICSTDGANDFLKVIEKNGAVQVKKCNFAIRDENCEPVFGTDPETLSAIQFGEAAKTTGKKALIYGGAAAVVAVFGAAAASQLLENAAFGVVVNGHVTFGGAAADTLLGSVAAGSGVAGGTATIYFFDMSKERESTFATINQALKAGIERTCYNTDKNIDQMAEILSEKQTQLLEEQKEKAPPIQKKSTKRSKNADQH